MKLKQLILGSAAIVAIGLLRRQQCKQRQSLR